MGIDIEERELMKLERNATYSMADGALVQYVGDHPLEKTQFVGMLAWDKEAVAVYERSQVINREQALTVETPFIHVKVAQSSKEMVEYLLRRNYVMDSVTLHNPNTGDTSTVQCVPENELEDDD